MATKALFLNCTLKPSPDTSNTEALAQVVAEELAKYDSDEGSGHEWSQTMARTAAQNLAAVARALQGGVIPPPPPDGYPTWS